MPLGDVNDEGSRRRRIEASGVGASSSLTLAASSSLLEQTIDHALRLAALVGGIDGDAVLAEATGVEFWTQRRSQAGH